MSLRSSPRFAFRNSAHVLAIATVVASVINGLLAQSGSELLSFCPDLILHGFQIWRPFTALVVALNPLEVIFGALIIYSIGGMLESRWGRTTFLKLAVGIPFVSECIVLLIALITPGLMSGRVYSGTSSVMTTLWILFGLLSWFSGQMLNFWGTPVNGKTFALIGAGFVVLGAAFSGLGLVLPELISVGLSYAYMYRPRSPRLRQRLELAYYTWKLERLKKKTRLRVVKGMRDDSNDSDPDSQIH